MPMVVLFYGISVGWGLTDCVFFLAIHSSTGCVQINQMPHRLPSIQDYVIWKWPLKQVSVRWHTVSQRTSDYVRHFDFLIHRALALFKSLPLPLVLPCLHSYLHAIASKPLINNETAKPDTAKYDRAAESRSGNSSLLAVRMATWSRCVTQIIGWFCANDFSIKIEREKQ